MASEPRGALPAALPALRERAIAALTDGFANDRLSIDEFESRVAAAYRAESAEALAALTSDLAPAGLAAPAAPPLRIGAVLGNLERAGIAEVPTHVEVRVVAGNVELDLRAARFAPGVTEIAVRAFMGNVEIRLPPHVAVESAVGSVLASVETPERDAPAGGAAASGAPASVVRLTGRAILSAVAIR